jgi:sugar lactone lactonase YvrE
MPTPDSGAPNPAATPACASAPTTAAPGDRVCTETVVASPISLYGGKAAGLARDDAGNLYVAENANNLGIVPDGPFVSKISPQGTKTIFAGQGLFGGVTALKFDAYGYLYVADGIGNRYNALPPSRDLVWRVDPSGNATPFVTGIHNPTGLAFDSGGILYVASFDDRAIYKFSPAGAALGTFVAGLDFGPYGIAADDSGSVFITGFGTSAPVQGTRIYQATALGEISVFVDAAPLRSPADLVLDRAGNLYASYYDSLKILRVAPDGSYTVFPGGCPGDDAANGLALDEQHGLLFTTVNGGRTTAPPAVVKLTGIVTVGCP